MSKSQTLTLSHITYSYPDSPTAALNDVSATFCSGWTGIVGDNGCGKSTLARIACGLIAPDAGIVTPRLTFAFCAQDAGLEPDMLYDFACDYSPDAARLRRMLNIDDDMPWRFAELSGGEQKKIQVAVALWSKPELLVIDEPTNHVDAACRVQIRIALASYKGIGLLVSHDRTLLDALVARCLCFEAGRAVMRPGTYSQAHAQAELERESTAHARAVAKSEEKRLRAEYVKRAEEASRAAAKRSARHLDPKDHDGKGRIQLAIFTGKDGVAGKLATRMEARVSRAQAATSSLHVEKRYEGDLWLESVPSPRKTLLHLEPGETPCGPNRTLELPDLFLGSTDHLGIRGPNGAGKSTLLRHVMALLSRREAAGVGTRTLFMPQEIDETEARAILADVQSMPQAERGKLLSIVAQLDSSPDRILAGDVVSSGELRKLMLARGILTSPELIVMDEPTNHLDIHSVEALERALAAFPGALVLVSHDDAFLSACCTRILELAPGPSRTECRLL